MMQSENALISVLIPSYNHVSYVDQSINSIILQDYENLELLICDDESSDGTWEMIQNFKEKCKRRFSYVYFFQQPHAGIHASLSKLLQIAHGEFVFIIASDDMAKPFAISTLYNFLKKNPIYGLCVGDNEIIDNYSKLTSKKTLGMALYANELEECGKFGKYEILLHKNHIPNGYLIRKRFFENFVYNPNVFEDYYTMLEISKKYKMKYINKVLFSYRRHSTNTITSSKVKNNLFEIEKNLFITEYEYCLTNNYIDIWASRIAKMILDHEFTDDIRVKLEKIFKNIKNSLWIDIFLGLYYIKHKKADVSAKFFTKIYNNSNTILEALPYVVYIANRLPYALKKEYIRIERQEIIALKLINTVDEKLGSFLCEEAYFITKEYLMFVDEFFQGDSILWEVYNKYKVYYLHSKTFQSMRKKIVQKIFISKNKELIKEIFEQDPIFILLFLSRKLLKWRL